MVNDLLERSPVQDSNAPVDLLQTNQLLRELLKETRKQLPKIACLIDVQGGVILNGVSATQLGSPVTVRFKIEANWVKSFYTVVYNTSLDYCAVTINEPNSSRATGVRLGNGYVLAPAFLTNNITLPLILPNVEIESLSIQTSNASPVPVNFGDPTTAQGMIMVCGWSLPEFGIMPSSI